jgi:uncharacterized protein
MQGMTTRIRWTILLALLLLVAAAVAGVAQPTLGRSATTSDTRTITVTGNGSVTTVPDRASFEFGVDTRAKTAQAAMSQNATEASAVIAALKSAGVGSADIQTSQVSLSPQTSQDGTTVTGYVASSSVSVQTSIANAGKLVDTAVGAGATDVSGPSLSRSDSDSLYRDALGKAVADAKLKAQALASAAGLSLGGVQSVSEGSTAPTPLPMAAKAADAGVPIEAGTQEIDASATVTYSVTG